MRGAVSQRRPASSPSSSSSSSLALSSSHVPALSSSPTFSSNPQPLYVNGQHGHIGPSSEPEEHISVPSPSNACHSVPPSSSVQHSNVEEDSRFMICPCGDS